jgi:hypothetical protein
VPADPAHVPEQLARTAVARFGPGARQWERTLRQAYPRVESAGIARLAALDAGRRGTAGGVLAGVSGVPVPAVGLGVVWAAQATAVLRIAAAHGLDPVDPARAVDLLVILGVHETADLARAALAETPEAEPVIAAAFRFGGPVAVRLGGWLALRAVNRLLPGAAVLVGALTGRAAAERAAARAVTYYRFQR